jgi:hypothetical protein
MTWVAAAIVGGAVVGAVGSNMAAGKQAAGQEQAAATQQQMFGTITGQEQPFLNAGYGATTSLNELLGLTSGSPGGGLPNGYLSQTFNPTEQQLENYPGYQFQLQQGGQAVRNADTPGVGALSGPALKDLMGFNQGLAASNYQNYFNQFQTQQNNIFNRLSNIASLGQNAAGNLGNSGTQLGTGIAQAQAAAAGSQASGIVGATNSISSAGVPLAYFLGGSGGGSGGSSAAVQGAFDNYNSSLGYQS